MGLSRAQELLSGYSIERFSFEERARLATDWYWTARREQQEPVGDWLTWLILAGRGFGKTRTGAETACDWLQRGICRRMAFVAPTAADARDVMVEGESGILAVARARGFPGHYEPSKRRITFPNGAIVTLFSAEEPDRLRGPQHDGAWADEVAAWADPQATWDQLQFGLRLGARPRTIATTTPRPIPLIRGLIVDPTVAVTTGSTYDNAVNLAPSFIAAIRRAYEGTRLGEQEIHAVILDDNPGALWKMSLIEACRVVNIPDLRRIAIGVDPAVSTTSLSNETGIIAAGVAPCFCKGGHTPETHAFVLEDGSGIYTPAQWASKTASIYQFHHADRVIAEVNQGGDLVESNLKTLGDARMPVEKVHASRGKSIRAEPVAALYEQRKVHHLRRLGDGNLGKLENQMTQWNPLEDAKSPDRLDALVWVLTHLMLGPRAASYTPPPSVGKRRI